jgi:hypothetical protein
MRQVEQHTAGFRRGLKDRCQKRALACTNVDHGFQSGEIIRRDDRVVLLPATARHSFIEHARGFWMLGEVSEVRHAKHVFERGPAGPNTVEHLIPRAPVRGLSKHDGKGSKRSRNPGAADSSTAASGRSDHRLLRRRHPCSRGPAAPDGASRHGSALPLPEFQQAWRRPEADLRCRVWPRHTELAKPNTLQPSAAALPMEMRRLLVPSSALPSLHSRRPRLVGLLRWLHADRRRNRSDLCPLLVD